MKTVKTLYRPVGPTVEMWHVKPFNHKRSSANDGEDDQNIELDTNAITCIDVIDYEGNHSQFKIDTAFNDLKKSVRFNENTEIATTLIKKIEEKIKGVAIPISKLASSITPNDSIYYRLTFEGTSLEFRIEQYFEYDENDKDDIEVNMSLYKSGSKLKSYGGSLEYVFAIINDIIWSKKHGTNC